MVYENALNIYTDGSSLPSPRRGGIGVRYITIDEAGNEVIDDCLLPGHAGGTNNEMELLACIKGLEGAREHKQIDTVDRVYVFTDSMYVKDNLPRARFQWSQQKWLNRDGRPVDNAELWERLLKVERKILRRVEYRWIKAHAKNVHNKAVDKLAKQSARGVLNRPLKVSAVRRKTTPLSVERGSVRMHGQVISVRIITDTFMRRQRLYKYKYEVLTEESAFQGKVDWIYSDHLLRAGHHYKVRVNDNTLNPRIVDVLGELERRTTEPTEQPLTE